MRILLDECVDWRLLRDLGNHDVKTVKQLGWTEVQNGALLSLASKEFDAFVTVDVELPSQQNAATIGLAVIVLRARTTRLQDLRELIPTLEAALRDAEKGEIRVVSWRDLP
jgi:predicted nuclease of predicted toxin-antitoxin system